MISKYFLGGFMEKIRTTSNGFVLGLCLLASTSLAYAHGEGKEGRFDDLGIFSDSGIEGPKYTEIEAELRALEKAYPNMAKVIVYGKSLKGLPLIAIKIELPGNFEAKRAAVVLTGATHGNEFLHIEDRIPRVILETWESSANMKAYFEKGGVFYITPVFNPDGYLADDRYNKAGKDLNRDFDLSPVNFKGFTQPETASFLTFLEKEISTYDLQLKITMDYHCCANAWLYPWSYTETPLSADPLKSHSDIAQLGVDIFGKSYEHGTSGQVLGYKSVGTSKDFYFLRFGSTSYTFEGEYGTEDKNLDLHVKYWDAILGRL